MNTELADLARSIFADAEAEGAGFDAELWKTLDGAGLARLTLPEEAGGSGATFSDSAVVLHAAGAYAARVPLVETDLVAGWLLAAAGLPLPSGPLTFAVADSVEQPIARVPWARSAAAVVVLTPSEVLLADRDRLTVAEGANLAEEPRDTVTVSSVAESAAAPGGAAEQLRLRAALGRAALLAGAADGALAASVRYAGERVQFGRSIGKFQAVQQQLALAGAEVAAAQAAASAAAETADADGFDAASTRFAVAAAKVRTGQAAGAVARIAHQVHGAIGFTREHALRLTTTRLWAWRDEAGTEAEWAAELGATAVAAGPDGLWPLITGTP
jgi:acyl-CoA dehydrogenase